MNTDDPIHFEKNPFQRERNDEVAAENTYFKQAYCTKRTPLSQKAINCKIHMNVRVLQNIKSYIIYMRNQPI